MTASFIVPSRVEVATLRAACGHCAEAGGGFQQNDRGAMTGFG
jgi:hypothetical protein